MKALPFLRPRVFSVFSAAAALAVLMSPSPSATREPRRTPVVRELPGIKHRLYAEPRDANYFYGLTRQQRSYLSEANATATITVTYDAGFAANPQAQAAFQAAVDIWANIITSSVPIRVNAEFKDLGAGLLGQAGPGRICGDFTGAPVATTFYAAALADKLAGSDICGRQSLGQFDIEADFNSTFTNWDFGTSGTPVAGKYNFMTVVLHELGHGLGFYGSADVSGTAGSIGYASQGFSGFFDIFDRFVFNGSGQSIVSFTDGSSALASQLVSNNLFFTGTNARSFNGGTNPKIESALNPFRGGSSYSHTDDASYNGTPNGLMTWALGTAEVYTDPGPIVRGIFADEGWGTTQSSCTYGVSPTQAYIGLAGGTGSITVTAGTGCAWTATTTSGFLTVTSGASGSGSGMVTYSVSALSSGSRSGTLAVAGTTVTITQTGLPIMALSQSVVNFGTVNSGGALTSTTPAQSLRLTQSGTGTVTWTVSKDQPWITVSPASGTGPGTISISINNPGSVLPAAGTLPGTVTVTTSGGANSPTATVNLTVLTAAQAAAPAGVFDTPANGQTGVTGSIAVTGWAVDDIGITAIRLTRDPVAGEGASQIFIGTANFVSGARPDIAAHYPTRPFKDAAGWGYLLLTNFLPDQGNGTFTLHAYADDVEGRSTLLGSKTITCSNRFATAPFGAIDTPTQGGTVSGTFVNFGWVLTPPQASIPIDASTISVFIDSASIGSPTDGGPLSARSDIQTLFGSGGYANINNSVGAKFINTSSLANGVHTIAWVVTDSLNRAAGIGSRFFTVSNSALTASSVAIPDGSASSVPSAFIDATPKVRAAASTLDGVRASDAAVAVRHGFDANAIPEYTTPDAHGVRHVRTAQLERVTIALGGDERATYHGYTRDGAVLRDLPVGSHLDARTGEFAWAPGLAFGGAHDLVFVKTGAAGTERIDLRVTIDAQPASAGEPQMVIDTPAAGAALAQPFTIAGWAIDPKGPANGTGIDTLHVWAYPVDDGARGSGLGARTDPIWIGVAAYGGLRPDVGDLFGPQYAWSGFSIDVAALAPGTYDIVVYAHSLATGDFTIARTLRVVVR